MIDSVFNIIKSVTDLIKAVADKAPVFLILLPVFFLGGDISSIVLIAVLGWFFLGGSEDKVKEALENALDNEKVEVEVNKTPVKKNNRVRSGR